MTEALIGALEAGLKLWGAKEATKYQDQLADLKRQWYEEYNRGADLRDLAVIGGVERELRILADSFASAAARPANS